MATGKPPWSNFDNPVTAMYHIACEDSLPEFPDSLSDQGKDFLRQCFIRDPAKRPDVSSLLLHPFVTLLTQFNARHLPSSLRPTTAGYDMEGGLGRASRAARLRMERPSPSTTPVGLLTSGSGVTPTTDVKPRFPGIGASALDPIAVGGASSALRPRPSSGGPVASSEALLHKKQSTSPDGASSGEPFKPPQLALGPGWDRGVENLSVMSGRSQLSAMTRRSEDGSDDDAAGRGTDVPSRLAGIVRVPEVVYVPSPVASPVAVLPLSGMLQPSDEPLASSRPQPIIRGRPPLSPRHTLESSVTNPSPVAGVSAHAHASFPPALAVSSGVAVSSAVTSAAPASPIMNSSALRSIAHLLPAEPAVMDAIETHGMPSADMILESPTRPAGRPSPRVVSKKTSGRYLTEPGGGAASASAPGGGDVFGDRSRSQSPMPGVDVPLLPFEAPQSGRNPALSQGILSPHHSRHNSHDRRAFTLAGGSGATLPPSASHLQAGAATATAAGADPDSQPHVATRIPRPKDRGVRHRERLETMRPASMLLNYSSMEETELERAPSATGVGPASMPSPTAAGSTPLLVPPLLSSTPLGPASAPGPSTSTATAPKRVSSGKLRGQPTPDSASNGGKVRLAALDKAGRGSGGGGDSDDSKTPHVKPGRSGSSPFDVSVLPAPLPARALSRDASSGSLLGTTAAPSTSTNTAATTTGGSPSVIERPSSRTASPPAYPDATSPPPKPAVTIASPPMPGNHPATAATAGGADDMDILSPPRVPRVQFSTGVHDVEGKHSGRPRAASNLDSDVGVASASSRRGGAGAGGAGGSRRKPSLDVANPPDVTALARRKLSIDASGGEGGGAAAAQPRRKMSMDPERPPLVDVSMSVDDSDELEVGKHGPGIKRTSSRTRLPQERAGSAAGRGKVDSAKPATAGRKPLTTISGPLSVGRRNARGDPVTEDGAAEDTSRRSGRAATRSRAASARASVTATDSPGDVGGELSLPQVRPPRSVSPISAAAGPVETRVPVTPIKEIIRAGAISAAQGQASSRSRVGTGRSAKPSDGASSPTPKHVPTRRAKHDTASDQPAVMAPVVGSLTAAGDTIAAAPTVQPDELKAEDSQEGAMRLDSDLAQSMEGDSASNSPPMPLSRPPPVVVAHPSPHKRPQVVDAEEVAEDLLSSPSGAAGILPSPEAILAKPRVSGGRTVLAPLRNAMGESLRSTGPPAEVVQEDMELSLRFRDALGTAPSLRSTVKSEVVDSIPDDACSVAEVESEDEGGYIVSARHRGDSPRSHLSDEAAAVDDDEAPDQMVRTIESSKSRSRHRTPSAPHVVDADAGDALRGLVDGSAAAGGGGEVVDMFAVSGVSAMPRPELMCQWEVAAHKCAITCGVVVPPAALEDAPSAGTLSSIGLDVVVTGAVDGAIVLQDVLTGRVLNTLRHTAADTAAASGEPVPGPPSGKGAAGKPSPDDSVLGTLDGGAGVGEEGRGAAGVAVTAMAYVENSAVLVTGSESGTMFVWDLSTGSKIRVLKGHTGAVRCCVLQYDSDRAVAAAGTSAGGGGRTLRRQPSSRAGAASEARLHCSDAVAASMDGVKCVSGSSDNTVRVWVLNSKRPVLHVLRGHTGPVNSIMTIPGTCHVVSVSSDTTLRVWDVNSGRQRSQLKEHFGSVLCVIPAPGKGSGGASAALGSGLASAAALPGAGSSTPTSAAAAAAAAAAASIVFVSAGRDGAIKTWNEKGAVVKTLRGHRGQVSALAGSPYDVAPLGKIDSRSESVPPPDSDGVEGAAWSAKFASCVLSSGADGVVRLWDVATGRCVRKFEGHKGNVPCLKWNASNYAVSGGADGMLRVWNVLSGQCASSFNTNAKVARAVGFGSVIDDSADLGAGSEGDGDVGGDGDGEEGDADPSAASSSVIVGSPRKPGASPDRFAHVNGTGTAPTGELAPLARAGSVGELGNSSTHASASGAHHDSRPAAVTAAPQAGITFVDWRNGWLVCSNKSGAVRAFRWEADP